MIQKGGTHWPGRLDGGGGRQRRKIRRDETAKVLQQYLTVTESWQNRGRTRNGLGRSETHSGARAQARTESIAYRIGWWFAEILSAVRGGCVDIATLATSAAQQKRKPSRRVTNNGATTDTERRQRPAKSTNRWTCVERKKLRWWRWQWDDYERGGRSLLSVDLGPRPRCNNDSSSDSQQRQTPQLIAWRTQHTGAHWR